MAATRKQYNTPARKNPQPLRIDTSTGAAILTVTMRRKGPRQGETYEVLVDVEDFPMVSGMTWTPMPQKDRERCCDGRQNNNKDHVYFSTTIRQPNGTYKNVSMHRFIMGNPPGKLVGFVHHNFMDLRKSQLYVGSQKEVNERMRKTVRATASRFKGVSLEWRYGSPRRYIAQAGSGGQQPIRIGTFPPTPDGEIAAVRAYDCFVLANFTNPNPNFRANNYTVEEIEAFKLDSDSERTSPGVLTVMPSVPTRRTGSLPGLQPSDVVTETGTKSRSPRVKPAPIATAATVRFAVGKRSKPSRKPVQPVTWVRKGLWSVPVSA